MGVFAPNFAGAISWTHVLRLWSLVKIGPRTKKLWDCVLSRPEKGGSRWPRRGQHKAARRGWPSTAAPSPGSSGRKFESCRIRLKLCRRYLVDPCTTPVKFGADRPSNKKVFGTMYFPGQGRQAASLAGGEGASRPRQALPLGPVSEASLLAKISNSSDLDQTRWASRGR